MSFWRLFKDQTVFKEIKVLSGCNGPLLTRRGAADLGEGATEPAGAHEDQHEAAAGDPANATTVAARRLA